MYNKFYASIYLIHLFTFSPLDTKPQDHLVFALMTVDSLMAVSSALADILNQIITLASLLCANTRRV